MLQDESLLRWHVAAPSRDDLARFKALWFLKVKQGETARLWSVSQLRLVYGEFLSLASEGNESCCHSVPALVNLELLGHCEEKIIKSESTSILIGA